VVSVTDPYGHIFGFLDLLYALCTINIYTIYNIIYDTTKDSCMLSQLSVMPSELA
jgi:hypothetical protein